MKDLDKLEALLSTPLYKLGERQANYENELFAEENKDLIKDMPDLPSAKLIYIGHIMLSIASSFLDANWDIVPDFQERYKLYLFWNQQFIDIGISIFAEIDEMDKYDESDKTKVIQDLVHNLQEVVNKYPGNDFASCGKLFLYVMQIDTKLLLLDSSH